MGAPRRGPLYTSPSGSFRFRAAACCRISFTTFRTTPMRAGRRGISTSPIGLNDRMRATGRMGRSDIPTVFLRLEEIQCRHRPLRHRLPRDGARLSKPKECSVRLALCAGAPPRSQVSFYGLASRDLERLTRRGELTARQLPINCCLLGAFRGCDSSGVLAFRALHSRGDRRH